MDLKLIKELISLARKQKLTRIKVGDFEADLSPQAWLSKHEQKALEVLIHPSPEDKEREYLNDLYHSAE